MLAFVQQIQEIKSFQINIEELNEEIIESNIVRCQIPSLQKTWNNAFWISNQEKIVSEIIVRVCLFGDSRRFGAPLF